MAAEMRSNFRSNSAMVCSVGLVFIVKEEEDEHSQKIRSDELEDTVLALGIMITDTEMAIIPHNEHRHCDPATSIHNLVKS